MLHHKKFIIAGCVVASLAFNIQAQETPAGPLLRWGAEYSKSETATADVLKKMAAELTDLKTRLQVVEESQATNHSNVKSQMLTMHDNIKLLSAGYDRLQNEIVAVKTATGVTQAALVVPSAKKPIEDGGAAKTETTAQDHTNKRLDEITAAILELAKMKQEVQYNSRDVLDLKKKFDAQQTELIQAQNDIGKLQQDMVKLNTRVEGVRSQADSIANERTRQSLALPTPPDSQANAAPRSNLGTLRFINLYPMTMTAIVDGQFFTLAPNQTLNLNKIPGYTNYEIVGVQGNTLRTINAAETLTVQIVPR